MFERIVLVFFRTIAVLLVLAGVGVLLFASVEQLASNAGVRNRHGGDMFPGLVAVLGEPLARAFVAGTFFGFAWLLWRVDRKRRGPAKRPQ